MKKTSVRSIHPLLFEALANLETFVLPEIAENLQAQLLTWSTITSLEGALLQSCSSSELANIPFGNACLEFVPEGQLLRADLRNTCVTNCTLQHLGCYVPDHGNARSGKTLRCNDTACTTVTGESVETLVCGWFMEKAGTVDMSFFPNLKSLTIEGSVPSLRQGAFTCSRWGTPLETLILRNTGLVTISEDAITGCPKIKYL